MKIVRSEKKMIDCQRKKEHFVKSMQRVSKKIDFSSEEEILKKNPVFLQKNDTILGEVV